MYYVYIDGGLAFDGLSDSPSVVSASISQSVNAAAYLDMDVLPGTPVEAGSSEVEVAWDGETLFRGTVSEVSQGIEGLLSVTAVSEVDRLNDVLVRPHSSDGSEGEKCPSTLAGYFSWLVERYNLRNAGGYRIEVGENQGALIADGDLAISDDSWSSVASRVEDAVLSRGGMLEFTPYPGGGRLDLWADVHEAADQIIDLGENVVDIAVTRSTEGRFSAVAPYSGDLTLEGAPEAALALVRNAGFSVSGDAVFDPASVAAFGYREERYEVKGAEDAASLARGAVAGLRTLLSPSVTVECRAVDMALYREGYRHLRVGQAARVRSALHGVDEYLTVQEMSLDLMDPSQTSYTLGVTYDSLTGQQSAFLRRLNASIDGALDRVTAAEDSIESVRGDLVIVGKDAEDAKQQAQQAIEDVGKLTEDMATMDEELEGLHGAMEGVDADVAAIKKQAQSASDKADEAWDKADQQAQQVEQAVQASKDAAAKADQVASDLSSTAADLSGKIADVTKTVTDQGTKIEGAVEDAGNALKQATELSQTVDGVKATAESALTTAQGTQETVTSLSATVEGVKADVTQATDTATDALSKATSVEATANGIKADLSNNYLSKTDASKTYATQASLSATSSSLTTKITEAATAAENAMDKATEVEQTASGIRADLTETAKTADSALSKATSVEATANGLKTTITAVQEDVDTAQSTADSAKTAASNAKSAADKAQTTANSASTNASTAISRVTSLSATVDGINTKVEQTATTASDALTKATSAQQSIDGFKTTVSQTYLKKTDASSTYATKASLSSYATKSSVDQTASQIKSEVAAKYATQEDVDGISVGGTNLLLGTKAFTNSGYASTENGYLRSGWTVQSEKYQGLTVRGGTKSGTAQQVVGEWLVNEFALGEEFTLSFWIKGTGGKVRAYFYGATGYATTMRVASSDGQAASGYGDGNTDLPVSSGWKRVWVTWRINSTGSTTVAKYALIRTDSTASGKTVYVCGAKLEKGNKPTDWSPAPEDMLSAADASATYATKTALTQTEDSITAEVAKTYQSKSGMASYATKSYVDQQDSSIKTTVSSVQTTANNALSKATTVEQTADGLEVKITSAVSTANTAKSTADSAKSTATTANNTANSAKTTATNAQNTANTANSTANAAKTAAANAQTAANNAAKTATNYLKFDSAGLCVGNQTTTLTYNTLIKATGVDIRNGSTVLSSFSASTIELGKNSSSSQVKMCGGKASVSYTGSSTELRSIESLYLSGSNVSLLSNKVYMGLKSGNVFIEDDRTGQGVGATCTAANFTNILRMPPLSAACTKGSGKGGSATAYKVGRLVTVDSKVTKTSPFTENETILTVPSGYRPPRDVWILVSAEGPAGERGIAVCYIKASTGALILNSVTWTGAKVDCRAIDGSFSYVCA
ncbi:hypothetical protein B5G20_04910 [Collinsella sp. An7]|uniref:alanine-zipper protein n=1 Tax=Collinsella sp. An7 TaxID=1965651 RepID=UPI000B37FE12|nr:alanine-zipper protein [Collinsella sp. An7]OUN47308.1 hypothetical protein B5G20_04910 [Collinsella sp. An7]